MPLTCVYWSPTDDLNNLFSLRIVLCNVVLHLADRSNQSTRLFRTECLSDIVDDAMPAAGKSFEDDDENMADV